MPDSKRITDERCDPCNLDAGMGVITEMVCQEEKPNVKKKCRRIYNKWLNDDVQAYDAVQQIKKIISPEGKEIVLEIEKDMFK